MGRNLSEIVGPVMALIVGMAAIISLPARILLSPWVNPWETRRTSWAQLTVSVLIFWILVGTLYVLYEVAGLSAPGKRVVTVLVITVIARIGYYRSLMRQLDGAPRWKLIVERWFGTIACLLGLYYAIFG